MHILCFALQHNDLYGRLVFTNGSKVALLNTNSQSGIAGTLIVASPRLAP